MNFRLAIVRVRMVPLTVLAINSGLIAKSDETFDADSEVGGECGLQGQQDTGTSTSFEISGSTSLNVYVRSGVDLELDKRTE